MIHFSTIALVLFALFGLSARAETEKSPRFLIHLLGYIGGDYSLAVEGGKVRSASEYVEMKEFAASSIAISKTLPETSSDAEITTGLNQLASLIDRKASPTEVAVVAKSIQDRVLKITGLSVAPTRWPDIQKGATLYQQNCLTCHGGEGRGDGPAVAGFAADDPRPANFQSDRGDGLSPFQAFNAIRLGVPGTSMAAFSALPETDVWDLAFYVVSMRHGAPGSVPLSGALPVSLDQAATLSDESLREVIKGDESQKRNAIRSLRLYAPAGTGSSSSLTIAEAKLTQALGSARAGAWDEARAFAIGAYLEGIEPAEPRLRARNAQFSTLLETKMAAVRSALEQRAPIADVEVKTAEAQRTIGEAKALLDDKTSSPAFIFSVAAGIFLREAFEAVLIIITLLGVIRSLGSRKAMLYVHGGWMLALGVGVVAWFFSGWVMHMSGANRELIEGAISLAAVVVLLYFGFWLHQRTEIGKWRDFISEMVKTALEGKKLIALGLVSFMAVFREAFETVLFLRALSLEAGPQQMMAMGAGVLVSFVLVVVLAAALVNYSARIPVRQLFSISSVVMIVLAIILSGKAAHAFQETGLLSITSLPIPFHLDLLGLYATWETLIPQIVVFGVCFSFLRLSRRPVKAKLAS